MFLGQRGQNPEVSANSRFNGQTITPRSLSSFASVPGRPRGATDSSRRQAVLEADLSRPFEGLQTGRFVEGARSLVQQRPPLLAGRLLKSDGAPLRNR